MSPLTMTLAAAALALSAGPSGLQKALDEALDDERRAEATYLAVMQRHGEVRPFVNIVKAEQRHQQHLLDVYAAHSLQVPANRWKDARIDVPATLWEACRDAAAAERANSAMYDRLLKQHDLPADAHKVFGWLSSASTDKHLKAFERCARRRGGRGPGPGRR